MDNIHAIWWLHAHWKDVSVITGQFLIALSSLFGFLTAFVKACPTLPIDHWLLPLIKLLGKITNNQTDDNAVRTQQEQAQNGTQSK